MIYEWQMVAAGAGSEALEANGLLSWDAALVVFHRRMKAERTLDPGMIFIPERRRCDLDAARLHLTGFAALAATAFDGPAGVGVLLAAFRR